MKYAIIAAGEGSRLAEEGIDVPKPLVKLCGVPMIERLVNIFRKNGAEEIVIIVNTLNRQTEAYVREMMAREEGGDIRLIVKTTPSSMHSFFELSSYLEGAPFCLTTVDTIFRESEFAGYIKAFAEGKADGMMAVTDYVDDEKPLYVGVDDGLAITGFFDTPSDCRYISGGIYCLQPSALKTLHRCMEEGRSRMRNFQRALVEDRLHLQAYPFLKILDVDHAADIEKAEEFLANT